jgi:gas vesicle protein
MNRLAIGAALGGLAVYLYDPQLGSKRRERLSSLWDENREGVLQAGRVASETIDSARPQVHRMTKAIGRTDWMQALDSRRPASKLPMLLGAAAIGGVVAYFLDPLKGSGRRRSALESGRRAVRQMAQTARPLGGRVGDHVADFVEDARSKVS